MVATDGGYDDGYRSCPCFWGTEVGSLVRHFLVDRKVERLRVLDVGCGEGKNAAALAELGADVVAVDCSEIALRNAKGAFSQSNVEWICGDIRTVKLKEGKFDLVVAYGLLHCLQSPEEINDIISLIQNLTAPSGWNIVCAFNSRKHDLSAHPGFIPCLLPHAFYLESYAGWSIEVQSDEDLFETHPHNMIPHYHSMTRLIARKVE